MIDTWSPSFPIFWLPELCDFAAGIFVAWSCWMVKFQASLLMVMPYNTLTIHEYLHGLGVLLALNTHKLWLKVLAPGFSISKMSVERAKSRWSVLPLLRPLPKTAPCASQVFHRPCQFLRDVFGISRSLQLRRLRNSRAVVRHGFHGFQSNSWNSCVWK